jgi:hypothetical protein
MNPAFLLQDWWAILVEVVAVVIVVAWGLDNGRTRINESGWWFCLGIAVTLASLGNWLGAAVAVIFGVFLGLARAEEP